MNNLVNLQTTNEGVTVSARELYEKLEIHERFSKWFGRMNEYGFEEDMDYTPYQMVPPRTNRK